LRWNCEIRKHPVGLALANLWIGLEALFGEQTDRPVTQKLAERMSSWLPQYKSSEIKDLYNRRCDVVHGRWLNEDETIKAIHQTEVILRRAIIKCIETGTKPLPDWQ
jgi:hypothetical protein